MSYFLFRKPDILDKRTETHSRVLSHLLCIIPSTFLGIFIYLHSQLQFQSFLILIAIFFMLFLQCSFFSIKAETTSTSTSNHNQMMQRDTQATGKQLSVFWKCNETCLFPKGRQLGLQQVIFVFSTKCILLYNNDIFIVPRIHNYHVDINAKTIRL